MSETSSQQAAPKRTTTGATEKIHPLNGWRRSLAPAHITGKTSTFNVQKPEPKRFTGETTD